MGAKAMVRGALVGLLMTAVTVAYGSFDRPIKVSREDEKEMKYYDTKFSRGVRAVFYNFRDGSLGLFQNVGQLVSGVGAGTLILVGKTVVLAGDVVGFADDNLITRPFFRGVFSDIIEQLSYYPFRCAKGLMLMSHEMDDIPIVTDRAEYINNDVVFKSRLYLRPWAVVVLPTTILADGLIRPVGSLAKLFSLRRFTDMQIEDIPDQLDHFGLRMILRAWNQRFFLPIPEEDEPDLRIYTEEEIVGIKPPGPMKRPTPEQK